MPNGGIKIEVLQDGAVQEEQTQYVCNGSDGENGQNGRDGCDAGYYYSEYAQFCVADGFIGIPAGEWTLTHDMGEHTSGEILQMAAFSLGTTPVTVAQFRLCVEAGACTEEHYNVSYASNISQQFCNYNRGTAWENHPMNCLDWDGAKQYCEWIGGRLPTEEEWEYASTHNGTEHLNTAYAFGDELQHCVNANYGANGRTRYCNGTAEYSEWLGTSAVGTYSPTGSVTVLNTKITMLDCGV